MRMNRLTRIAAGAAGAAALLAVPTQAGAAQSSATTTTTTVTTCGYGGLQAGVWTAVCADVTGTDVQLYGRISLAGPPSPGGPPLETRDLITGLSGQIVGGASLGSVSGYTRFTASTVKVTGVGGTVPCGSTVHGSFSVAGYPWGPSPVTLDVVVPC
ncbi:hypothetical protein PUR61_23310 [Streptomyces sp. BE20]|uniref:hypothetical protein n=2 Tax=Streptomycetaceae TaxID=2062 RepID=UPI002E77F968|nr:hypothetical protein [Streptomyces sp. BE20]MEE1825088.1 hypothetical protein [Streptomyces sp. BE20]